MTKKSIKRRIRKSKKTVKRSVRHKIVSQIPTINPNASVRSNLIPSSNNNSSGSRELKTSFSARSQMLANMNPLLPIALSQTPQNINLDAIHNMRNQNDLRQQQINDTKREKMMSSHERNILMSKNKR